MLINMDLTQIEVCIFAQFCRDPLLIKLINDQTDLHRYIASNVFNKPEQDITQQERSDAKQSTFGILYGNGPKTLSERTGRDFEWCKNFIQSFYEMFPKAKEWHNEIIARVNATGELKLFTGEVLKFIKYPAKYDWQFQKGIVESYNPPDIKNYPVQHTAALLMKMIISDFYRKYALRKRDKYLLINTVHDSLMLDSRDEYIEECLADINETLDNVPNHMLQLWNEKLLVPIKIDISMAETWYDL